MSDTTLRLAEACERAAEPFSLCEDCDGLTDDSPYVCADCKLGLADAAQLRALAAALRGATPYYGDDDKIVLDMEQT